MSSPTKNTNDDGRKKEEDDRNGSPESEKELSKKLSKSPQKTPQKAKKAEIETDEESEEDDDRKPGLLDLPLEVSGARERKKVERLDLSFNLPTKEKKADFVEGFGHKLGDCPRIEVQLQKFKVDDLKPLHRLIYNRLGASNLIKKNLRKFNGFPFDKDSADYERKKANLDRSTTAVLKKMCELLDLEKGGTKEELISRLMEFLLNPQPSGKPIQKTKKRKSSTTTRKTKNDNKKADKDNATDKTADKKEEESKSEGGSDVNEEGSEEDKSEDIDQPKKTASESKKHENNETQKKTTTESKKKVEKKKVAPKKASNKTVPKGNKRRISSSGEESSDDEPLVKKAKQPPTDDELKSLIKSILDGANLEEITMKTVCKQVYAKFPEFDLSQRKEFIKTTVRSIIS